MRLRHRHLRGQTESGGLRYDTSYAGSDDIFVAKFNPAGSALVYSTYLGGTLTDVAYGIKVDASGNAYVTGRTTSADYPTTPAAYDVTLAGSSSDVIVTKLNAAGSALEYSTYIGGSGSDGGRGIAVDGSGSVFLAGETSSMEFPSVRAIQTIYGGDIYDAFVARLNAAGSALIYSTFLGGRKDERGYAIAIDPLNNAYVTGSTRSEDFPSTPAAFDKNNGGYDGFVAKIADVGP